MKSSLDDQQISLSSQVRYRAVDSDGVVVHLESGRVIVINEVGLHILQLLKTPRSRKELVDGIVLEFEVSVEEAEQDLERYLVQLNSEQILEANP